MLRYIEGVRSGIITPSQLVSTETAKRSYSIELSKFKDVEAVHSGGVNDINIEHVEGRYLLSGGSDGSIFIHDLENLSGLPKYTSKAICKINRRSKYAHEFSVETVQWYPFDTGIFTTSGMDRRLKVWDTNRMKPADTFVLDSKILCHHMSPIAMKHNLIAVGTSNESLKLVDLKSGCYSHELRGHKGSVMAVLWSPSDEHLLASASADNRVILWDVRSARGKLKSLDQHNGDNRMTSSQMVNTAHSGAVNSLCFTEFGNYLASYGTDNRLRVWNVRKGTNTMVNFGKVINDFRRNVKIEISTGSEAELLYVPSESNIIVYELHSGTRVNTLLGHFNSANCCKFHPFYHDLYSGGNDRNILTWTPDEQQECAYDEHIRASSTNNTSDKTLSVVNTLTMDTWSSDEEN